MTKPSSITPSREKLLVVLDSTQALGIRTSSPLPVRRRVSNMPMSTTVPSLSPTRTYSPLRSERVYIRIRPAAPCATMLEAPIDTIRPASTVTPWKAAVCEPGR